MGGAGFGSPLQSLGGDMRQLLHKTMSGVPSLSWVRRNNIKDAELPRISICVPVGGKGYAQQFETPDGQSWTGPSILVQAMVPVQWVAAQHNLVMPLNTSVIYTTHWGLKSGEARQIMTKDSLAKIADDGYILYWDDDTIPPPLGLYTLFNYMEQHPEVGLLSGVYCTRSMPVEPVVYREMGDGADWSISVGPTAMPQEVWGLGAGFMLVRAQAIKDAEKIVPDEPVWADCKVNLLPGEADPLYVRNALWGHDIRFCDLIRRAGWKVMADGRVECGHYDVIAERVLYLPPDSLPKRRGKQYAGEGYWDTVYGIEGAKRIRNSPELLSNLLNLIEVHDRIVEVGCGPGILGSLLTAQKAAEWVGYDHSSIAVDQCNSRFLNAYQKAVHALATDDLGDAQTIIAVEVIEHLQPEDAQHLFDLVMGSGKRLIVSVPDNCMGPEEVPEHVDLFSFEKVEEITATLREKYGYSIHKADGDAKRVIVVLKKV